ncbi:MAG: helix-turn-helix transcriptional regulator [Clostridia bacterium]|nr:helix-turn-helix transcriptional regulator [Clostridia bacterium]
MTIYKKGDISLHHSIDEQPKETDFVTHAHRCCELLYFISGNGFYTVEGTDYPLTPGSVLIMRYGEVHKLHISPDTKYERIVLNFPLSMIEDNPWCSHLAKLYTERPIGKGNLFLGNADSVAFIDTCMRRMCRENVASEEERLALMFSNLTAVLSELRNIENGNSKELNITISVEDATNEIVGSVISYINAHLTEDWTLDTLEQEFFFSKSYINRAFKQSTGSSVWDYVVLKRLLVARNLLREGKNATVAAAECGFRDYSSFYRQYKRRFGISPIDDRRNNQ